MVLWVWDTGEESVVTPRQEMLVKDSRRWRRKTQTLNPINLAVIRLWQVGLIMQHKGKTNRLYLRRVAIIYYAYSYHRTNNCGLTGATDSLPQHVIYISAIYHVWCGSANIWLGVIYTSQDTSNLPSHISLYGPPCRYCPKRKSTGPYFSSHWVRRSNTPTTHSHTHTWQQFPASNQPNCSVLENWITWRQLSCCLANGANHV